MTRITVNNPVVTGHAPDPSVVRVGNDFYLAVSSFDKLPGIPIRHSTDLVNWKIIGHAVSRPAQYRRDGKPGPIELFAPTLRYHDGVFYLITTNAQPGQRNFYVTATDPAGEWSDAIWVDEEAFDPSLFRDDDGTWYYTRRSLEFGRPDGLLGPIVQAEIDIHTGQLGELRAITPGGGGFVTNDIEGPHIYRRGDWYYLSGAEGSSWKGHLQSIGRSKSPWGPYEPAPHNPILSHRDRVGHPIQATGHVELFDDPNGNWWAVALGTRHAPLSLHHNIGRETFLAPVTWTDDGWPIIGEGGGMELSFDTDVLPHADSTVAPADSVWRDGWFTQSPAPTITTQPDGTLLVPAGATLWDRARPKGALLRHQTADDQLFVATVADIEGDAQPGVTVQTDVRHNYTLYIHHDEQGRRATLRRQADDLVAEHSTPLPSEGELTLSIEGRPTSYRFTATIDGTEFPVGEGSARLLSAEAAEWFVSASFGLLAIGTSGSVRYRDVNVSPLDPQPSIFLPAFIHDAQ